MEKKKVVAARKTPAGKVSVKVEKKAPAKKAPPAPAAEKPFTEEELRHFEELLKQRLRDAGAEMEHLEETVLNTTPRDAAGDLSAYSFHMADLGTDAMEREMAFQKAAKEGGAIKELREALKRLYRGEYGLCESCTLRIARPRLEAVPEARLCITCKEKEERRQRMMRE
ncbi:MAG: TraR/DksA C4-type zinc finger protein [Candidatus Eisenbacteria bacterium]|nr:TraR/DksA C4-type zinc finger protein [Candidatus Eisenbacteria bacterium]